MRSASGISAAGFFESAATGSVRSSALSLIRIRHILQFCENLCVPGSLKHVCAQTLRVLPILIRDIPRPFAKPIFLHINYLAPNSCRFSANLLSFYTPPNRRRSGDAARTTRNKTQKYRLPSRQTMQCVHDCACTPASHMSSNTVLRSLRCSGLIEGGRWRANIEGVSDPYKGYTPLVRKARITRLTLMPICCRFTNVPGNATGTLIGSKPLPSRHRHMEAYKGPTTR